MSLEILIVEDEQKLAASLSDYLTHQNYTTHLIHEGTHVVEWVQEHNPDFILLDLMLPGKDGISICREIREFSNVPIIMITARTDEIDRLLGLELGADDYICKPYSLREVEARMKATLRRMNVQEPVAAVKLELHKSNFHITYGDKHSELTAVEFNLLEALASTPGRIYSRDALMTYAYPDNRVVSDRTVDSHIKKLRKKLAELAPDVEFIHSIYGAGYKYDV